MMEATDTQYNMEQFKKDILFFNTVAGWKPPSDFDTYLSQLRSQALIVQEEVGELQRALIADDKTEQMDGMIDVAYTFFHYEHILGCGSEEWQENIPLELAVWMRGVMATMEAADILFFEEVCDMAAQRVAENNNTKITQDEVVALEWAAKSDHYLVDVEVDGVTHYCLKDANGKVKKPFDFVSVDLADLAVMNTALWDDEQAAVLAEGVV